jgi:hypothetical protein
MGQSCPAMNHEPQTNPSFEFKIQNSLRKKNFELGVKQV